MKLAQIKPVYERFENDHSAVSRKRLEDSHFELAFKAVKNKELDQSEIKDLAKEMGEKEEFDRTDKSAVFILSRMHVLVHGMAPHGFTERSAERLFQPSGPMNRFAKAKGIDVDGSISKAKQELQNRPVRIKEPEAKKMMSDYYRANKDKLKPSKEIGKYRNKIIADLMAGKKPEEVFAQFKL